MNQTLVLQLMPQWEEVSRARKTTAQFLRGLSVPRDVIDAVSMITCELTENATKYGEFEKPEPQIDVRVAVSRSDITVEVTNPVSAEERANLSRLDRMVQWIRGFQDPFEAYMQRLREISTEGLESHESRLGLVRIAYEGQSILDFYVNENDVLAVSATRRF